MPFVLQNVTYCTFNVSYCTLQFQILKSFIEQQYQSMETVKKTLDHMKGWVNIVIYDNKEGFVVMR